MKFSGKMCFKIISKVFTLSLEDTIFEKPGGGGQIDPPPFPAVLRLTENILH